MPRYTFTDIFGSVIHAEENDQTDIRSPRTRRRSQIESQRNILSKKRKQRNNENLPSAFNENNIFNSNILHKPADQIGRPNIDKTPYEKIELICNSSPIKRIDQIVFPQERKTELLCLGQVFSESLRVAKNL